MSSFDFGIQFLDAGKMTYWGKRQDARLLDRKRECRVEGMTKRHSIRWDG